LDAVIPLILVILQRILGRVVEWSMSAHTNWHSLHWDLREHILLFLELAELKALKCLNMETANACRRTLRSERWQEHDYRNTLQLEDEVCGSFRHLKFPLTVSIEDKRFGNLENGWRSRVSRGDQYLLATIHRMNLLAYDEYGEQVDLKDRSFWRTIQPTWSYRIGLIDLCVEVHGYGIVSSETGLRMLIEKVIQERGKRECWPRGRSKKRISDWEFNYNDEGLCDCVVEVDSAITTKDLLEGMRVRTQISENKYLSHDCPLNLAHACSVWDLMKNGLGPFERFAPR